MVMSKENSWRGKSGRIRFLCLVAGLTGLMGALAQGCSIPFFQQKQSVEPAKQDTDKVFEATKQAVLETYSKLPLSFEANQGAVAIENAKLAEQMRKDEMVRTNLARYLPPQIVEQVIQKDVKVNLGRG